jgi:protein gp37
VSEQTNIEWCDSTFNPWIGCTKVSPGCDNCYAERDMSSRLKVVQWGPHGERVRTKPGNWNKPLAWNAKHEQFFAAHGRRQRVFCASLADVFDVAAPDEWRSDLAKLILQTPNLDWLLLTKRIGNADYMLREMFPEGVPSNLWLGATIVNQTEANRDIPKLLKTNAHVRFLSMEPLLGAVDLTRLVGHGDQLPGAPRIDWVIVGGESGPNPRPMHPGWVRSLRDQCKAAAIPFLFKQWGELRPATTVQEAGLYPIIATNREVAAATPQAKAFRPMSGCFHMAHQVESMLDGIGEYAHLDCAMFKAGKKAAGRLLDGCQHDGYPEPAAQQM